MGQIVSCLCDAEPQIGESGGADESEGVDESKGVDESEVALRLAIDAATRAVAKDVPHEYNAACLLYSEAVCRMRHAMDLEWSTAVRFQMRLKLDEYEQRPDTLTVYLRTKTRAVDTGDSVRQSRAPRLCE
jgi:uncharacterized protein (DUF924 family)